MTETSETVQKYRRGVDMIDGVDTSLVTTSIGLGVLGVGLMPTIRAAPLAVEMAEETEKKLLRHVKEIFPALDESKCSEIVEKLIDLGVDEPSDIEDVKEEELKDILKPVKIRKLLRLSKKTDGSNACDEEDVREMDRRMVLPSYHNQDVLEMDGRMVLPSYYNQAQESKEHIALKMAACGFLIGSIEYLIQEGTAEIGDYFQRRGARLCHQQQRGKRSFGKVLMGAAATGLVRGVGLGTSTALQQYIMDV